MFEAEPVTNLGTTGGIEFNDQTQQRECLADLVMDRDNMGSKDVENNIRGILETQANIKNP